MRRRYWRLQPAVQRRLKVAVPYFGAGVAVTVAAFLLAQPPEWPIWLLFAGLYFLLELLTVEVNDRLFHSSSIMVVMTAGVIFAIQPDSSAVFAMALMAGFGAFVPDDFRQRRWFQPMANFGQQAVSGAVAGLILDLSLSGIGTPVAADLFLIALASAAAALAFTVVNNFLVRRAVQIVYPYDRLQPWSHLGTLFVGQFTMGLLGGLIGGAYLIADRPAILVLIVGVYAIGHMSLYAFSQLRVSHLSALKGFVKTLEAKDMYTRGHTERVAYFAEVICEEYGFSGTQIEQIKWAALIHDLGKLAVPTELIRKRGRLDDEEYAQMQQHAHLVEEILAEVDFLQPMVEIASGHHSHYDGNGYGGRSHTEGETPMPSTP
jgi:putative nucleotidyltransferase with HDIG domain